jgi:hypothetical protein
MRILEKILYNTVVFVLAGLVLLTCWIPNSVYAQDFYPSIVLLNLQSEERIVNQDPFFEILDYEDYILLPLSALSQYLDLELDYKREQNRLFIYYPETGERVEVDFEREIYPDFPEWNSSPPYIYKGDFYVSKELIEQVTGGYIEWLPRRQEVIFNYDGLATTEEEEDKLIKERPEPSSREPDVVGPSFSLGSLQYQSGLSYKVAPQNDFSEGNLYSKNNIYLHGRAGNWALSLGQKIDYNFQSEIFQIEFPLIRAVNREHNRVLLLGDYSVNFKDIRVKDDLRGIYLQYPQRQLFGDNSYTSITGEAEPGSTVQLFLNGQQIDEQYIYQGEQTYHFAHILLKSNRTNIFQVVIKDKEGKVVEEITEKIAGSPDIYEKSVKQFDFFLGKVQEETTSPTENYIGGMQTKYALSENNSILWEIAASREEDESGDYEIPVANLLRFAHRTNWPLVLTMDWLAGGDINSGDTYSFDNLKHGARFNVMYTLNRGYISADLDYIPPGIDEYVLSSTGGRVGLGVQRQISNSWLLNMRADAVTSIEDMPDMDMYRGNLALNYRGLNRNSLNLSTEYGKREQINFWQQLNAYESDKEWLSVLVGGRTRILKTDLNADLEYKIDRVNFLNTEESIRFETADAQIDAFFRLTDNMNAAIQLDSTTNWLEGELQDQNYNLDTRFRRGTENTVITLGYYNENYRNVNSQEVNFDENRREMYAEARYFPTTALTLTGELRDTYLHLLNDDYLTVKAGINYVNREQNWQLDFKGSYLTPVGPRETSQEKLTVELTKVFSSGQKLSLAASREYSSIYQNDPSYSISLNFSHSLDFLKGKISGQQYTGATHRSEIRGVVYLDEKGTGVRDENDSLLSDISLYREGARTVTNERGEFKFNNVRSGLHEVGIDLDNLSAKYNIITEEKIVRIRENENIYLEFGVTMSGTVSGRVFVDRDVTGTREKDDEPMATIGIEIEELRKKVYTRSDGTFYFEKIPLGEYTLTVLPDSLPANMRVFGEEQFKVIVTEDNLEISNIDIPLVYGNKN